LGMQPYPTTHGLYPLQSPRGMLSWTHVDHEVYEGEGPYDWRPWGVKDRKLF
jgi:hypothetical protein